MVYVNVADRLSFGCKEACNLDDDGATAIVHACKNPCHRNALGYRNTLPQEHPHYLVYENGHHQFLNMIDPPTPLFRPESFKAFLRFVDREIRDRHVLIHCEKGESRAPSLSLLYMAKRLGLLPDESYEAAAEAFEAQFPYNPGRGISTWLSQNWYAIGLDQDPEDADEDQCFYHFDRTGVSLSSGHIIEFCSVPPEVDADEETQLRSWFPDGLTRFGAEIALRRLEPQALAREIELEKMRRHCFKTVPSRYTSVFGCRSLEDIRRLRWQFGAGHEGQPGKVWKIKGKPVFRGDMNLFMTFNDDPEAVAELYWSGQESDNPLYEYLLEPPITVVEELDGLE